MQKILFLLACVVASSFADRMKYYHKEKTEREYVREYEMDGPVVDSSFINKLKGVNEDRGTVINCGDKSKKFNIQWSPKTLSTHGSITIYWDLVAPVAINEGKADLTVYKSSIPVFSIKQGMTCEDIHQTVKNLTCPIKAGAEIRGSLTYPGFKAPMSGSFRLVGKITNESNQMFICGDATVQIN